MQNLLKDCKVMKISNGAGAGTTEVDSSIIDMAGFDGVLLVADLGTVTDNSVITFKAQDNTANSSSGMADVTGATTGAITAATASNTILAVDVVQPQKRYVRAVLTRTTQNAVVNTVVAVLYKAKSRPVTADASVLGSALEVGA